MTYRIDHLMGFEVVQVEGSRWPRPPRAVECTTCHMVIVEVPPDGPCDLDDVLAPCAEHRQLCREIVNVVADL